MSVNADLVLTGCSKVFRVWSLLDGSLRWTLAAKGLNDVSALAFVGGAVIGKGIAGVVMVWTLHGGEAVGNRPGLSKADADHTWQAGNGQSINQKCLATSRHYLVTGAGRTATIWVTEPGQRRVASENLGVSLKFLLEEFEPCARNATALADPTFREVKDAFWTGPHARPFEGCDHQQCPRDGKPGCSLADVLAQRGAAGKATHFLSWTWSYRVSTMVSALRRWASKTGVDPEQTFIWICFFVNNQCRILLEQSVLGSDDLGEVFAARLQQCGRVLVLLDSFKEPLYVQRVWCVYETFQATKHKIPLEVILPDTAFADLTHHLKEGRLDEITRSLNDIRVEDAQAWSKDDEENIKREIRETIGYDKVDDAVQSFLSSWMVDSFKTILEQATEDDQSDLVGSGEAEARTDWQEKLRGLQLQLCECKKQLAAKTEELRQKDEQLATTTGEIARLHGLLAKYAPAGSALSTVRSRSKEAAASSDAGNSSRGSSRAPSSRGGSPAATPYV